MEHVLVVGYIGLTIYNQARMELPKFHETFLPILETLNKEGTLSSRELIAKVKLKYYDSLPIELKQEKTRSGKNKHHLVIAKLQNNEPITPRELEALEVLLFTEDGANSKEEFIQHYGEKPLGVFIRSVVGLSKE